MEIFPSKYIHIGGDEAPKVRWEECPRCQARIKELGLTDWDGHTAEHYLQSYVTARVEVFERVWTQHHWMGRDTGRRVSTERHRDVVARNGGWNRGRTTGP